jgi:hypothetical protein
MGELGIGRVMREKHTSTSAWEAAPTFPSIFSSSPTRACILSESDRHSPTSRSFMYLPREGNEEYGVSPRMTSTLLSGRRPWRQQAQQNSSRTESVKGLLFLLSSNIEDKVGKAFVSTLRRASVMQYSGVKGGNICLLRLEMSRGSLFIRYDLRRCVAFGPSFRKTALARTSNDARMRSMVADCTSPWHRRQSKKSARERSKHHLPGIYYSNG